MRSPAGKRQAACLARRHPLGIELAVEVDGELYQQGLRRRGAP
jgi:hypothetical protein